MSNNARSLCTIIAIYSFVYTFFFSSSSSSRKENSNVSPDWNELKDIDSSRRFFLFRGLFVNKRVKRGSIGGDNESGWNQDEKKKVSRRS